MVSKEKFLSTFPYITFFCVCGGFSVRCMKILNVKLSILITPVEISNMLIKSRASLESLIWLS